MCDKIIDYYLDYIDVKYVDLDIEDNELVVKGKLWYFNI